MRACLYIWSVARTLHFAKIKVRSKMTKSLSEIQKENRKFILEAIHGCSYEEALDKELGVGCKIILEGSFRIEYTITDTDTYKISRDQIIEIIGKPLTLSRVLLAISKHGYYDDIYFGDLYNDSFETLEFDIKGVSFDLTKETLEEQTEETQRGINKFFND